MIADPVARARAALDDALARAARSGASPRLAPSDAVRRGSTLTARAAVALFVDQVTSRELDGAARALKAQGVGYYTISSAGHEANAVLGAVTRATDPAFLHYRAGAFVVARARTEAERAGAGNPRAGVVRDVLLSMVASREDPIAQGRHKVWGSRPLWIPPQTSTIASHVPKAVGTAFALERARRLGLRDPDARAGELPGAELPEDAIVVCSFGDASANHATALAGLNAARWSHRRGAAVPVLFVCEDNGIGISVETPRDWIRASFSALPHLRYVAAAGALDEVWDASAQAVARCRATRAPTFLHLQTVRLWGHAGSDVEATYRTSETIRAAEAEDPVVRGAVRLVELGAVTAEELADLVDGVRRDVAAAAAVAAEAPHLDSRAAVVAPLAPYDADAVRTDAAAAAAVPPEVRASVFGSDLPERATAPARRTLAALIGAALADEMARRPEALVFGEDVGRKGGVYHVTSGLQERFGALRVFDTLLDETTILGVAQGAGLLGLLPVPEIQYLAYVHNALDQLRGEASSLQFFSSDQFANPMVVRVAGLAYQKGFGGHFHNDNAIGALRDIPGLALAVPARGPDGVRMLRGALAMARTCGRVVVFLEPIALYHEKDLHEPGDGLWLGDYPPPGEALLPGEVGLYGPDATQATAADPADLLLVSYANGLRMALRTARRLHTAGTARCRVLDLRWLAPLPLEAVRGHAEEVGRVLVVDEARATGGGVADALVADLAEHGFAGPLRSVRSADSYVPLGPAADHVLLGEGEVEAAARALVTA